MFKHVSERTSIRRASAETMRDVTARIRDIVRKFITESLDIKTTPLVRVEYTAEHDVIIITPSKPAASSLILRMTELRADVRIAGIKVRRIIVR